MAIQLEKLKPNNLYLMKSGRYLVFKELNKRRLPVFFPPGKPDFLDCFAIQRWAEMITKDLGPANPAELERNYIDEDDIPRPARNRGRTVTNPFTTIEEGPVPTWRPMNVDAVPATNVINPVNRWQQAIGDLVLGTVNPPIVEVHPNPTINTANIQENEDVADEEHPDNRTDVAFDGLL